jgi:hypothetical protein
LKEAAPAGEKLFGTSVVNVKVQRHNRVFYWKICHMVFTHNLFDCTLEVWSGQLAHCIQTNNNSG